MLAETGRILANSFAPPARQGIEGFERQKVKGKRQNELGTALFPFLPFAFCLSATASPVAAPLTLPPCLRLLAPLYLSCAASGATPDGLRARRKPLLSERPVGTYVLRYAVRQFAAPLSQQPPRNTRPEPPLAPSESTAAVSPKSPSQSCVHSNRFPCRSNKPRMLGRNSRGGRTCLPLFSANQPNRPSRLTSPPKP